MIMPSKARTATRVATWSTLEDRRPAYALVANVDLVVIRYDDQVSVLFGRCLHRGALLSDGHIRGDDLICGVHNWDYRYDTGVSSYNPEEALHKFGAWIDTDADTVFVDEAEVAAWHDKFPQAYRRDEYLGLYADVHGTPRSPTTTTSRNSRATDWRRSATTALCRPWACRSPNSPAGATCRS